MSPLSRSGRDCGLRSKSGGSEAHRRTAYAVIGGALSEKTSLLNNVEQLPARIYVVKAVILLKHDGRFFALSSLPNQETEECGS